MPNTSPNPLPRLALLLVAAIGIGAASYFLLTGPALANSTPAYSSLRTDPSGSSILFGAYARAGLRVVRGFDPDSLATMAPKNTVAFVLAPEAWANDLSGQLYDFAQRGGLVVLAAPPLPVAQPTPDSAPTLLEAPPKVGLEQRLGASLVQAKKEPGGQPTLPAVAVTMAAPVNGATPAGAQNLPVLDPLTTLKLSPAWSPLYRHDGHTYMAMRALGQGRVVLAGEATFLSNDNLARSPDAALLSWFAHDRSTVWVDETLHDMEEVRGVAWLLRRYHLQPAVLGLLATLGLLAWSVGVRLERPPDPAAQDEEEDVIESADAGYIRLLQRAIPVSQLLEKCRQQYALRHPRQEDPPLWPHRTDLQATAIVGYYQRAWQRAQAMTSRSHDQR